MTGRKFAERLIEREKKCPSLNGTGTVMANKVGRRVDGRVPNDSPTKNNSAVMRCLALFAYALWLRYGYEPPMAAAMIQHRTANDIVSKRQHNTLPTVHTIVSLVQCFPMVYNSTVAGTFV